MLRGAALDRFGDVLARFGGRLLSRLRLEPLDQIRGIAPRIGLDLLEQKILGFLGGQARQTLQLVLLCGDELFVFGRGRQRGFLALDDRLGPRLQFFVFPFGRRQLLGERRFPASELLLGLGQLHALFARDALGLGAHLMGLFLCFEQRLFLAVLSIALGILQDTERLFFGPSDGFGGNSLSVGDPIGEDGRGGHGRDGEIDDVSQIQAHKRVLKWFLVPGSGSSSSGSGARGSSIGFLDWNLQR